MSWLIRAGTVGLWHRWLDEWRAVPWPVRRRWWIHLGWGLLAVQLLTLLLTFLARRSVARGLLAGEERLLLRFEAGSWLSFNDAIWLDVFGNGFLLTSLVAAASFAAVRRSGPFVPATLLIGYGSLFLPVVTAWQVWPRERPTVIAQGIGSPGASISSFPSGHLVQTIVAFGMLAFLWMRATRSTGERIFAGSLFLLLVTIATLARLRLGAHWPSDMAAAAMIGGTWLAVVLVALTRAERRAAAEAPDAGWADRSASCTSRPLEHAGAMNQNAERIDVQKGVSSRGDDAGADRVGV